MTPSHIPPALLVTLLSAATFLARTAALVLGPLLVALASAGGVLWVTIHIESDELRDDPARLRGAEDLARKDTGGV